MRRTREEIYNIYLKYVVIDKDLTNAAIARELNICASAIGKFRKGFVPPVAANPKPPSYYNHKYAQANAKSTVVLTVANNLPLKEQIIILLKDDHSVRDVAEHLDLTPKSVAIVKAHSGLDNRIKATDNGANMSFEDISYALSIDESEVIRTYQSGLGKLFDLIGDIGNLKAYLEDDIPSEFRNTGEQCSKHYSSVV